jgi:hypothetical protein
MCEHSRCAGISSAIANLRTARGRETHRFVSRTMALEAILDEVEGR